MDIFNLYKNYIIQNKQTTPPGPVEWKGLCFTALSDTYVRYIGYDKNIKYSIDGINWTTWSNNYWIDLSPSGPISKIYVKGDNPNGLNTSGDEVWFLGGNQSTIKLSGNINSLIDDGDGSTVTSLPDNCYHNLFYTYDALADAEDLLLPATTLGINCYRYMFGRCINMITAPKILPATTLGIDCYAYMFSSCTNMIHGPAEISAKILTDSCCESMFERCSSLKESPHILADTVENNSLSSMFYKCTSLNKITIDYTGEFNNNLSFLDWVYNVAQNGDFYYNGNDTTRGSSAIPTGWTVHTF